MTICVNDVEEAQDIRIIHFLEQRNLADGGGWNALIFSFEANFLQGDYALVGSGEVASLVHNTVCALWVRC